MENFKSAVTSYISTQNFLGEKKIISLIRMKYSIVHEFKEMPVTQIA